MLKIEWTDQMIRNRILQVAEKVRIKRNGEVHAFGRMPSTNKTGWYLYGRRNEIVREFQAEYDR